MQMNKSTFKKIAIITAGAVILHWLLNNPLTIVKIITTILGFFTPFIAGFIIAFLLNIPIKFVERVIFRNKHFKGKRALSFLISLIVVVSLVSFVMVLVVPELVNTISLLVKSMPGYYTVMSRTLKPYEEYVPQLQTFLNTLKLDWDSIIKTVVDIFKNGASSFFNSAVGVAGSIISWTSTLVIGLIFSIYIILDKEHLIAQFDAVMKAFIPDKYYKKALRTVRLTNDVFSRFVSGQCLEGLALTVVYFIAMTIGRFDYALLISVLIGFLSLIPFFGALIACVVGALLLLISSGLIRAVAFVILFIVIQQFDGNLMYPRIVGNSVGLPPVWVLVAVTLGASIMGIMGILLFIPLSSVVYTLVAEGVSNRLVNKGYSCPEVKHNKSDNNNTK